jgi:hypothetical protein
MQDGNSVNWKAAALPLAVLTAALAVGISYFVGGNGGDAAPQAGGSPGFKFDSGPQYAPGSQLMQKQQPRTGSSIDMFREVNKNYSADTAAPEKPAAKSVARPKTKAELREFMSQVRGDINFDPAAMAAAGAQSPGGAAGRNITNPILQRDSGSRQAQGSAVQTRLGGAGAQAKLAPTLASRKSSFSAGRMTGAPTPGGASGLRNTRGASGGAGDASTGQSTETGFTSVTGGSGRSLEAGAYGSHGGGAAAQSAGAGAGAASAESPQTMGGGPQEEKAPPAPVAFVWQRSVDFGTMYTYETAARQVIVMNIGDAPLKLGKISNLDDETPFFLEKDKCSSVTLTPGKSCTFRVRFSPKSVREYLTGFEIPSNDSGAMTYQSYIEVKGVSKYSYSTWWWHNYSYGAAGYNNRLNFGMVPEGYAMDQVLRITNNTGDSWDELKLDAAKLPSDFKLSGDGCTGGSLGPQQSCSVTVTFTPTAAGNRKYASSNYGQYHSVNMDTGAKLYHARPHFPPLVLEGPVEASPAGSLKVLANYHTYLHTGQTVLEVPVEAKSSAPFPVTGLVRVQHYYYFK